MFRIKVTSCLFLIVFTIVTAWSQDAQQMSEAQVARQRDYIDADLAFLMGEYETAVKRYKALYNEDRNNAAIAYGLARSYAGQGKIEDTKKYISVAIENAPDNKWYKLWHANYFRDLGDHLTALQSYGSLYEAEPTDRYFAENYAYSLLALDRPTEAISVLNKYEEAMGRQELLTKKKWQIYDNLGNQSAALAELKALAEAHPAVARLWLNLAKYAQQVGEEEEAIHALEQVVRLEPLNVEAKRLLSQSVGEPVLESEGELSALLANPSVDLDDKILSLLPQVNDLASGELNESASQQLASDAKTVAETHPTSAKALALHGDVLMHRNAYAEAAAVYRQAISLNTTNFAVYSNLLYVLLRLEEYESLAETGEQAIDYFPNEVLGYYYFARGLAATDQPQESLSIAQEGSMVAGGNAGLETQMKVAIAYAKIAEGQLTEASTLARSLDAGNGWVQELLGDLATHQGKSDEASRHYQQAARLLKEPLLLERIKD